MSQKWQLRKPKNYMKKIKEEVGNKENVAALSRSNSARGLIKH